jgi:tetraacyldisaccharide 4'-kinase
MRPIDGISWPLSLLYGAATHLRVRAYSTGILKPRCLPGTIISVGNLTVGGTGKTPMVLWIVEKLLAEGKRVGILTRGYRGDPNSTSDSNASDEVRLMQNRLGDKVELGVGPNRFEKGGELAARGVNCFVLDDGFQHLQLARDVNIVLIDALNPFGGGRLLPAGRLREPLSALRRANIVVITRTAHAPAIEAAVKRQTDAPIFYAQPSLDAIRAVTNGRLGASTVPPPGQKLFAFCGIGNPHGFLITLRDAGFAVAGQKSFPDHHRYTARDAEAVVREAHTAGATALICTEKDLYNLNGVFDGKENLLCATISMQIDREGDFWATIKSLAGTKVF